MSSIRRTGSAGDLWHASDPPLNETYEGFVLRVLDGGGAVVRDVTVGKPSWIYSSAEQGADGIIGAVRFSIAQISDRYGPRIFGEVEFDG